MTPNPLDNVQLVLTSGEVVDLSKKREPIDTDAVQLQSAFLFSELTQARKHGWFTNSDHLPPEVLRNYITPPAGEGITYLEQVRRRMDTLHEAMVRLDQELRQLSFEHWHEDKKEGTQHEP